MFLEVKSNGIAVDWYHVYARAREQDRKDKELKLSRAVNRAAEKREQERSFVHRSKLAKVVVKKKTTAPSKSPWGLKKVPRSIRAKYK